VKATVLIGQEGCQPIRTICGGPAILRNSPNRDSNHGCRQREINEKYPAPGSMLSQPPRTGPIAVVIAVKTRPDSNRLTAAFVVEGLADNREAARDQKVSAHTLGASSDDQLRKIRCKPANDGGQGECCHTRCEDEPPAKQVAERAARQNQGPKSRPYDSTTHCTPTTVA